MRRLKTVRRPPIYPNEPSHLPCSSLTHPAAVLTPSIGVLRWIRAYRTPRWLKSCGSQGSLMTSLTSLTSMTSRRKGRRSDRRDGAKGPVRCLLLPHLRGQTAEVPHGDHLRRGVQPV